MASVQDIETKVATIERKLDFIMSQFRVKKVSQSLIDPTKQVEEILSLAEVYREITSSAADVAQIQ